MLFSFESGPVSDRPLRLVGPHRRLDAICVLRDPFNLLASIMKRLPALGDADLRSRMQTWKSHARLCLGETLALPGLVDVNYNRWVVSPAYRASVLLRVDLPFTDRGLDEVPDFGGGSSFDQRGFEGRGGEMAVLDRWRCFQTHPVWRRVLEDDPEVAVLAERYFAFNPLRTA